MPLLCSLLLQLVLLLLLLLLLPLSIQLYRGLNFFKFGFVWQKLSDLRFELLYLAPKLQHCRVRCFRNPTRCYACTCSHS